jgi:hypothetical protein
MPMKFFDFIKNKIIKKFFIELLKVIAKYILANPK